MNPQANILTGILMTVAAGLVFAGMDGLGKHLSQALPVLQIVWGRYFVQTLLIGSYLWRTTGTGFLKSRQPKLQLLRGAMLLCTTVLMYVSISHIPLADATSVLFCTPMIVTLLSVVFLGERIGLHRIGAILAGFAGVLLIVQPGLADTNPYLMLPILAALVNSVYLLLTRRLAYPEEAAATQFNTTATGAVLLSVIVIPIWQTPSPEMAFFLVAIGVLGSIGHFTLVRAFAHAPASLLSPYLYGQVVAATVLSVVWFGDPLRASMLAGTVVLVLSGLYIWWRENRY